MYSTFKKNTIINIYNELENYNIIGQKRKDFITKTFGELVPKMKKIG